MLTTHDVTIKDMQAHVSMLHADIDRRTAYMRDFEECMVNRQKETQGRKDMLQMLGSSD
jgi:hypothetical protein